MSNASEELTQLFAIDREAREQGYQAGYKAAAQDIVKWLREIDCDAVADSVADKFEVKS